MTFLPAEAYKFTENSVPVVTFLYGYGQKMSQKYD